MTAPRGRGRLSSIEQLPDDCADIVAWAAQELRDRQQTQQEILASFNEQLQARAVELGITIEPISKSAFNRYSIRLAGITRRITEAREVASAVTARLQPGQTDDLTIMTSEMIKVLAFELLSDRGEAGLTPKNAMELARAVSAAVAAQKASSQRRADLEARVEAAVEDTIETVREEAGLSAERAAQIRREVLGVRS